MNSIGTSCSDICRVGPGVGLAFGSKLGGICCLQPGHSPWLPIVHSATPKAAGWGHRVLGSHLRGAPRWMQHLTFMVGEDTLPNSSSPPEKVRWPPGCSWQMSFCKGLASLHDAVKCGLPRNHCSWVGSSGFTFRRNKSPFCVVHSYA